MSKKKIMLFLFSFIVLVFGFSPLAFAAPAKNCPSYTPKTLCAQDAVGVNALIANLIQFIIAIAGLVVLAYIIWAGFKFITSGGDASKKEEAQKQIVAAVIGLLIIVFSYFIVSIVFNLLGLGSPTSPKLPCDIYGNDTSGVNSNTGRANCLGGNNGSNGQPQN